jgi:putative adhesin
MKRNVGLLAGMILAVAFTGRAETEDHLQKSFTVSPGGKLVVDVNVGSIDVTASNRKDVAIDVYRKVDARGFGGADREKAELQNHEVTFTQEGNSVIVRAQRQKDAERQNNMNLQFRYVILVPTQFAADLKTRGGSVKVADLNGDLKAHTSGGSLKFAGIRGPIDGHTSGGSIDMANSDGKASIKTSGGSIKINKHKGDVLAKTSGGSISVEDVEGQVQASTSGGSVSASLAKPSGECRLETSGGGINVAVPGSAALDIDAKTGGGSVHSDLPVAKTASEKKRNVLQGKLNGGGTPLVLRTSGGSIHLKKL